MHIVGSGTKFNLGRPLRKSCLHQTPLERGKGKRPGFDCTPGQAVAGVPCNACNLCQVWCAGHLGPWHTPGNPNRSSCTPCSARAFIHWTLTCRLTPVDVYLYNQVQLQHVTFTCDVLPFAADSRYFPKVMKVMSSALVSKKPMLSTVTPLKNNARLEPWPTSLRH